MTRIRVGANARLHLAAAVILAIWCLPYLTSGTRIDRDDFTMFAQAYEAIRVSILHYHQFPWMNPWMAGGVPLYADPQIGLFSIQTPLVLIFGAPIGLKIALTIYTVGGYFSMNVLLRRFLKVGAPVATMSSLLWIMCSYFVARFPQQFTFVWYMLMPFYVYLSLTSKGWRGGVKLGAAFSVMALSQVHNPFFQIGFVCSLIVCYRLIRQIERRELLKTIAVTLIVFVVVAGHRVFFVVQNAAHFSQHHADPAPNMGVSLLGFVMPYLRTYSAVFDFEPKTQYGFRELTVTLGICFNVALVVCLVSMARRWKRSELTANYKATALGLLVPFVFILVLGLGTIGPVSIYGALKHLPVFSSMRVPSRWYIFGSMLLVAFVAVSIQVALSEKAQKFASVMLLCGIVEALLLNHGFENQGLQYNVAKATNPSWDYPFVQVYLGGESSGDSRPLPLGKEAKYREYEATQRNEGVLHANTALFTISPPSPRCSVVQGCQFVQSQNAHVTSWSPNRVVLTRTAPGPITLDMNDSFYWTVNGNRRSTSNSAEPLKAFTLNVADNIPIITLTARPLYKIK